MDEKTDQKSSLYHPDFRNVLEVTNSRPDHLHDQPSAAFIQRYSMAAALCYINGENPTLALMALKPFKLGEFSLGDEINALLFDDSKNLDSQEQRDAFEWHFSEIIKSVKIFHQDPNNDPHLIQTAIGLQMFIYAAFTRMSNHPSEDQKQRFLFVTLLNSLFQLNARISYPARFLLNPSGKYGNSDLIPSVNYQPHSGQFIDLDQTAQPLDDLEADVDVEIELNPASESKNTTITLADIENGFNHAYTLAQNNQFEAALTQVEIVLEMAKKTCQGNFLRGCFSASISSSNYKALSNILNYLKSPTSSPQQQTFAIKVLNKIIKQDSREATELFRQKDAEFLNALINLKPQSPEAVLELGKLFKALAGHQEAYQPKFRTLFEAKTEEVGLYKKAEDEQNTIRLQNLNIPLIITGGVFIVLAIITTIVSITLLPLLPLYIAAAVVGVLGLGILTYASVHRNRIEYRDDLFSIRLKNDLENDASPSLSSTPMIKTNFHTWLNTYLYDSDTLPLEASEFIDLFKQYPYLSGSISPLNKHDKRIFHNFFGNNDWIAVEELIATFNRDDKGKIAEFINSLPTTSFRNLITNLEQLKTFFELFSNDMRTAIKESFWANVNKDYLNTLIQNTPTTISTNSIGSAGFGFGGNVAAINTQPQHQDPFKLLKEIFPDHDAEIDKLKKERNPEDESQYSQSPVTPKRRPQPLQRQRKKDNFTDSSSILNEIDSEEEHGDDQDKGKTPKQ